MKNHLHVSLLLYSKNIVNAWQPFEKQSAFSGLQLIVVGYSLYFPFPVEKEHKRESFIGIYPSFQLNDLLYALLSEHTESLKRALTALMKK